MSNNLQWYKEKPSSHTVLLFGEIFEDDLPQSVILHLGQDAYEGYQIFIYIKELLRVRQTDYLCWSPAFEFLYVAMVILSKSKKIPFFTKNKKIRFEEIGSTFFSSIDKLAKIESRYLEGVNLKNTWFYGVEVSQIFSDIAVEMHSGYHLSHYHRVSQIPLLPEIGIGRSYQATSYAFPPLKNLPTGYVDYGFH